MSFQMNRRPRSLYEAAQKTATDQLYEAAERFIEIYQANTAVTGPIESVSFRFPNYRLTIKWDADR